MATTDLTPAEVEQEVWQRMTNPSFVGALHDYVDPTFIVIQAVQIIRDPDISAEHRRSSIAYLMDELIAKYERAMQDQVRRGW